MFDGSFRTAFDKSVVPVGRRLQKLGVSPDFITFTGVLMAGVCGVAIGLGQFPLALLLLILTGVPDALDGAVAKAGGRSGPRGAFLDSVSDRLSDALIFAGSGWYLLENENPRLVMLPFALYIAASLVSYERAKAESLGFDAKGGIMERAERFIALGFGLLFNPWFTYTLWVMLALTVVTVGTRFVKVWKQASVDTPKPARRTRRRSRRRASGRSTRRQASQR